MSLEGQLNQFVMNHFSSMRLLEPEHIQKGSDVEIHHHYMTARRSDDKKIQPQALFLETRKEQDMYSSASVPNSMIKESPRAHRESWSEEYFNLTLSDAVTRGDFGYVERVALQVASRYLILRIDGCGLQMLSMARTRDSAKLQDLIASQFAGPVPPSSSSTLSSASTVLSSSRFSDVCFPGHGKNVTYSPHILSVGRHGSPAGKTHSPVQVKKAIGCTDFSSELIPNNLPGTFHFDTPARQVPDPPPCAVICVTDF
eukprot:759825-Hanusia_phi.AAC.7